jgi:hypothetical protein
MMVKQKVLLKQVGLQTPNTTATVAMLVPIVLGTSLNVFTIIKENNLTKRLDALRDNFKSKCPVGFKFNSVKNLKNAELVCELAEFLKDGWTCPALSKK